MMSTMNMLLYVILQMESVSDLSKLPNKARLRVKVYNTTATETKR